MLLTVLSSFANEMSNYLRLAYKLTDDLVVLNRLGGNDKISSANKMIISLVNVERETNSGIQFNYRSSSATQFKKTMPAWQLNLYVLIVAAFSEKQYEEGLQLLSGSLLYIQNNNTFAIPGTDISLTVEPVNLSFNELSNLWSICGSSYYPSILCKIRMLNIGTDEIKAIVSKIDKKEVKV